MSAPLPPRIIEKCLASDRIIIDTVVGKYCNHTPLHRQSMILERDLGLEISRATEEINDACPLATVLPQDALAHAMLSAAIETNAGA